MDLGTQIRNVAGEASARPNSPQSAPISCPDAGLPALSLAAHARPVRKICKSPRRVRQSPSMIIDIFYSPSGRYSFESRSPCSSARRLRWISFAVKYWLGSRGRVVVESSNRGLAITSLQLRRTRFGWPACTGWPVTVWVGARPPGTAGRYRPSARSFAQYRALAPAVAARRPSPPAPRYQ